MDNTWIYISDAGRESGNEIKDLLDVVHLRDSDPDFRGNPDKAVINWGSGTLPRQAMACTLINDPNAVALSVNKRAFFRATYGAVHTVPWTTSHDEATKWLLDGHRVVCRRRLGGRDGQGIAIAEPYRAVQGVPEVPGTYPYRFLSRRVRASTAVLEACPLYTRFIPGTREYRVHCTREGPIVVHKKVDGHDEDIRNTTGGWLFRRVTRYPEPVLRESTQAISALDLDFGAVDVLWDGTRAWVLETNTAPDIRGMEYTKRQYCQVLERLVNEKRRA